MNGKFSRESLTHFQCHRCNKWWSIGDAPAPDSREWFCPWCGTKQAVEDAPAMSEPNPNTRTYIFAQTGEGCKVFVNGTKVATITTPFITLENDLGLLPLSVLRGIYEGAELLSDRPQGSFTLKSGGFATFR